MGPLGFIKEFIKDESSLYVLGSNNDSRSLKRGLKDLEKFHCSSLGITRKLRLMYPHSKPFPQAPMAKKSSLRITKAHCGSHGLFEDQQMLKMYQNGSLQFAAHWG